MTEERESFLRVCDTRAHLQILCWIDFYRAIGLHNRNCAQSLSMTWDMEIKMTMVEIEAEIAQSSMDHAEFATSACRRARTSSSKKDADDDTQTME